jgi:hypothetical protein
VGSATFIRRCTGIQKSLKQRRPTFNGTPRKSEQHVRHAVAVSAAVHDNDRVSEERRQWCAQGGRIARVYCARTGAGGRRGTESYEAERAARADGGPRAVQRMSHVEDLGRERALRFRGLGSPPNASTRNKAACAEPAQRFVIFRGIL